MPVFQNSEQLYAGLRALFTRIQASDPTATRAVVGARMLIRLKISDPAAEVTVNGRKAPVQIGYGPSAVSPDLDVELSADALHRILLAEVSLTKALGSGQMKVRGAIWKTRALEDILQCGQALYPQVLRDHGLDGYHSS